MKSHWKSGSKIRLIQCKWAGNKVKYPMFMAFHLDTRESGPNVLLVCSRQSMVYRFVLVNVKSCQVLLNRNPFLQTLMKQTCMFPTPVIETRPIYCKQKKRMMMFIKDKVRVVSFSMASHQPRNTFVATVIFKRCQAVMSTLSGLCRHIASVIGL